LFTHIFFFHTYFLFIYRARTQFLAPVLFLKFAIGDENTEWLSHFICCQLFFKLVLWGIQIVYFRILRFLTQRLHIYLQEKIKAGFHMIAIDLQSLPWLGSVQKKVTGSTVVGSTIAIISRCDCFGRDHLETSHHQLIFSPSTYDPTKREVRKP